MIIQYYRVSVDIPEVVHKMFGHTPTYERHCLTATAGSLNAGSYRDCGDVEEWAEFATQEEARLCELRLIGMIAFFKEKL